MKPTDEQIQLLKWLGVEAPKAYQEAEESIEQKKRERLEQIANSRHDKLKAQQLVEQVQREEAEQEAKAQRKVIYIDDEKKLDFLARRYVGSVRWEGSWADETSNDETARRYLDNPFNVHIIPKSAEDEYCASLDAQEDAEEAPVARAFNVLDERDKQLIELHLEGKSYRQIAQAVGVRSHNTAKTHLTRALLRLELLTQALDKGGEHAKNSNAVQADTDKGGVCA